MKKKTVQLNNVRYRSYIDDGWMMIKLKLRNEVVSPLNFFGKSSRKKELHQNKIDGQFIPPLNHMLHYLMYGDTGVVNG